MQNRYSRNRLYVNNDEQKMVRRCPILLAGSGVGSNIAECALRFGFENITIVDGDKIELSNLNRQNYTMQDISEYKAETLYNRLKIINPNANIRYVTDFIDEHNVSEIIDKHQISINALDFSSDIPILFDRICQEKNIPVLHPYNLGWGGMVTVVTPKGFNLEILNREQVINELNVVEYVCGYLKFWQKPCEWLESILNDYKNEKETLPPPQLSIGSWYIAAMCTQILYRIATGKEFKKFPEFYFNSLHD